MQIEPEFNNCRKNGDRILKKGLLGGRNLIVQRTLPVSMKKFTQ